MLHRAAMRIHPDDITEPGWYWADLPGMDSPSIVRVAADGDRLEAWPIQSEHPVALEQFAWFIGPLHPPEGWQGGPLRPRRRSSD